MGKRLRTMKASEFTEPQKAFILKQEDEFVYPPHLHALVQVAANFSTAELPERGIKRLLFQSMRNVNKYIAMVNQ